MKKVALETAKTATEESTVSLSEVVLRSQNEYGQTKSVKTRLLTERKTRHQVKVQNWRGERSMR